MRRSIALQRQRRSVEMKSLVSSNELCRQSTNWRWRECEIPVFNASADRKMFACVFVGSDFGAYLMQHFIAVSVSRIPVRVDHMPYWIIAKMRKCVLYLRARNSGVDKHFAIAAGEHSYVSSRTFKNANVTPKIVNVDFPTGSSISDRDDGTFRCSRGSSFHVT